MTGGGQGGTGGWLPALALLLAATALSAPSARSAPPPPAGGHQPGDVVEGAATALEGDALLLDGEEFRLFGIDAPDPGQMCKNRRGTPYDCFAQSTKELDAILKGRVARCTVKLTPKRERTLVTCTVQDQDIATIMVRTGWALAYRRLSFDYVRDEMMAVSHRVGMWGGRVQPPWEWRDEQAAQKAKMGH